MRRVKTSMLLACSPHLSGITFMQLSKEFLTYLGAGPMKNGQDKYEASL